MLEKNNRYYIVMGTNVGTTVTAYFAVLGNVSFTNVFLLLLPVTAIVLMVTKNKKITGYALAASAFFMVFAGINVISSSVPDIVSAINLNLFLNENKFKLLFFSTLITAICQSSSVISLIVVMLVQTKIVGLESGIFLIMGANLGTCSSALLAAIGKSRKGSSVAVFNVIFNLVGVIIHVFAYYTGLLNWFLDLSVSIDTKIAIYHTLFNLSVIPFFIPVFYRKRKSDKIKITVPATSANTVQNKIVRF